MNETSLRKIVRKIINENLRKAGVTKNTNKAKKKAAGVADSDVQGKADGAKPLNKRNISAKDKKRIKMMREVKKMVREIMETANKKAKRTLMEKKKDDGDEWTDADEKEWDDWVNDYWGDGEDVWDDDDGEEDWEDDGDDSYLDDPAAHGWSGKGDFKHPDEDEDWDYDDDASDNLEDDGDDSYLDDPAAHGWSGKGDFKHPDDGDDSYLDDPDAWGWSGNYKGPDATPADYGWKGSSQAQQPASPQSAQSPVPPAIKQAASKAAGGKVVFGRYYDGSGQYLGRTKDGQWVDAKSDPNAQTQMEMYNKIQELKNKGFVGKDKDRVKKIVREIVKRCG